MATQPQFPEGFIYVFCLVIVFSLDLLRLIKLSSSASRELGEEISRPQQSVTDGKMSSVHRRRRYSTEHKETSCTLTLPDGRQLHVNSSRRIPTAR
jgi:hypothetical protein